MKQTKKVNVSALAKLAVLVSGLSLTANATLVVQNDSSVGITNDPPVSNWTNTGTGDDFTATFSRRPTLVNAATPTGQDALNFNGADSGTNQMLMAANSAFDSAPSLTFMMVLNPNGFSLGNQETYLNSSVAGASGSENGWGLYHNNLTGNFEANARATTTGSANSTISSAGLGALATDWMILTGVYDSAANTIQLYLTDAAGTLHTGAAQSITLASGAHLGTQLGSRGSGRVEGGAADIAAVRIWDEALDSTARAAQEAVLYSTYVAVPEPSSSAAFVSLVAGGLLFVRRRSLRS